MSSTRKAEFETYTGIRPSTEMLARIHSIIEEYCDKELEKVVRKVVKQKLKEIVRECLEEKEKLEKEVVELRKIPKKEAIAQIKAYIDKHQGCRTGDIIYDLALDPDLVLSVLKELREKRKIRSEDI